jgi:molecular chaperone DnaK
MKQVRRGAPDGAMSENPVSRDSQRVPLETRVQLKFEWFGGFISEYSANISPGGMFIRTQTPEPVGRLIGFELRLGDGYELIRGTGEVVWARMIDQGPDKQAGMGIRFLEISPDGRELIYQMVDNYIAQGGTPFDVTDMPGPGSISAAAGESTPAELERTVVPPLPPPALANPATPATPAMPPPPAQPPAAAGPVPPFPVDLAPEWPPTLAASAPRSGAVPEAPPSPEVPELPELPAAEVPPRRGSGLVRWAVVGGVLVLAVALAILKQETLLGWFLPTKGPRTADLAAAPARLPRHPAAVPAAPPPTDASPAPSPGSTTSATSPTSPKSPAAAPDPAPTAPPTPAALPPPVTPPSPQPVQALPPAAAPATPAGAAEGGTGGGPGELQKITWKQDPDGTEVILWADGAIRRQDWAHYRIDGDSPRELVKLYGIHHPFPSSRLVAGTRQLLQVRTGYHDGPKGNELHVVLDLSASGVEVTGIEAQGEQLHIHLKGK